MTVIELITQLQQIENKEQEVCIYDFQYGDLSITNIDHHYRPASNPDQPKRLEKRWITLATRW